MTTDTTQFAGSVPQPLRDKLLNLAELAAEFIDALPGDTWGDDPTIEPVEYESRDGFMSSNDGGYSVQQYFACGWSSGYYRSDSEREFIERIAQDAFESFKQENNIEGAEIPEMMLEQFYDYENDYMSDCYTLAEIEIMLPRGDDTVQICYLLHYGDVPYFRPKYAEQIGLRTYALDQFMGMNNAAILAEVMQ